MQIQFTDKGQYLLLAISGALTIDSIHEFKTNVITQVKEKAKHLILDTSGMTNVDTTGVSGFVALQKALILANCEMAFVQLNPKLKEAFDLAGILNFFSLHSQIEDIPWLH